MKQFSLRKGLDIPISGAPRLEAVDTINVKTVGVLGDDYIGLKPRIHVAEDDLVGPGTPILANKDFPDVQIVSPVAGRVKSINRGARRKLISIEIAEMCIRERRDGMHCDLPLDGEASPWVSSC